jgi:hypothetical protein
MAQVGDKIKITNGQGPFFHEGDIAILKHSDASGKWWADFNKQSNVNIFDHGVWCVGLDNAEIYQIIETKGI